MDFSKLVLNYVLHQSNNAFVRLSQKRIFSKVCDVPFVQFDKGYKAINVTNDEKLITLLKRSFIIKIVLFKKIKNR
jgi:hypothetical protein